MLVQQQQQQNKKKLFEWLTQVVAVANKAAKEGQMQEITAQRYSYI